jgi:hypothetical protein
MKKKQPPETLERLCKHAVGICTICLAKVQCGTKCSQYMRCNSLCVRLLAVRLFWHYSRKLGVTTMSIWQFKIYCFLGELVASITQSDGNQNIYLMSRHENLPEDIGL